MRGECDLEYRLPVHLDSPWSREDEQSQNRAARTVALPVCLLMIEAVPAGKNPRMTSAARIFRRMKNRGRPRPGAPAQSRSSAICIGMTAVISKPFESLLLGGFGILVPFVVIQQSLPDHGTVES